MNTVNQLLSEMNKLKGDKVALEEELKAQRRSQVRDRVKRTITSRDVALAASNKVSVEYEHKPHRSLPIDRKK